MILNRCKNCKYYNPEERKVKSIFSSKVKTKYLRKGDCIARKLMIGGYSMGFYKPTNNNAWCEKYERKAKRKEQ